MPADGSVYNFLLANRPGLTTPEVFAIHRTIDVVLGLLLIFNLMRSVGTFFGEDGSLSVSISGPLITRAYFETLLQGLAGSAGVPPRAEGSDKRV